jgi:MtrB/PioB family decaheme-associated outer membrane protein
VNIKFKTILSITVSSLLALSASSWAQENSDTDDQDAKKTAKLPVIFNELTIGTYYLDQDSYRFGKYSGLKDKGWYAVADFRLEKRPVWDSGDTVRWRLQGWRLGLASRRLLFDYNDQGTQKLRFDYRQFPNNRFSDGLIPYREQSPGLWNLAPGWEVAPGSSDTTGFTNLQASLVNLKVDTNRRRMDLNYDRKLGSRWVLDIDLRNEVKKGTRSFGGIFGYTGGNPRGVILAAPVDWHTNTVEAMFRYTSGTAQFGAGFYGSFFSNDEKTLTFQNAYGRQDQWAKSVSYPGAQGRIALEPGNHYLQFKAYGGINLTPTARITADFSRGVMKQNNNLLPYTVNPDLVVYQPVPLTSLDAKVTTTMLNVRLTSQLARRLGLRVNYRHDERDNKTQREVYPYIGADSQNQRPYEEGRINLPYSYTRNEGDVVATWRVVRATRLRFGVEYKDYERDYMEVANSHEFTWLAGVILRAWSMGSLNFDYRNSSRNIDRYNGNVPLIASHVPGTIGSDEWENHPLLRKYFLTARDRNEYRLRADLMPMPELNLGFAISQAKDTYDDQYFGLNEAKVSSWTVDGGWYPRENISLTGFYTNDRYDSSQSGRQFNPFGGVDNPDRDWWADINDRVNTWNAAITFSDMGDGMGWKGLDVGADYTYSNTKSHIVVTAVTIETAPLPDLVSRMQSFSFWASLQTSERSSIRLTAEKADLKSRDWGLDNVVPDSLANVLLLGESAANYDLWLISGSWTFRF